MKFKKGDRVKRDDKVGSVSKCYSKKQYKIADTVLGPYPELYSVQWDDGSFGKAYLPHGIQPIN